MGYLSDIDPVAEARTWLLTRERVTAVLSDRIGPANEPPYPCLRITDPPGSDRTLNHLIAPTVQLEVYGDLDGTQSDGELRRILYIVLEELALLPTVPTEPGRPVVTHVGSLGGGGRVPEPNGQPRFLATVSMSMHPPQPVPAP